MPNTYRCVVFGRPLWSFLNKTMDSAGILTGKASSFPVWEGRYAPLCWINPRAVCVSSVQSCCFSAYMLHWGKPVTLFLVSQSLGSDKLPAVNACLAPAETNWSGSLFASLRTCIVALSFQTIISSCGYIIMIIIIIMYWPLCEQTWDWILYSYRM